MDQITQRSEPALADDPRRCHHVSITLPKAIIDRIDRLIAQGKAKNRSDVIRKVLAQVFKAKEFTKLLPAGRRPKEETEPVKESG